MKICFVYSNRAEFSEIEPFYKTCRLSNTVRLLNLSKIIKNLDDDRNLGQVYSKCYTIFSKNKFDFIIVLGDRRELPFVAIPAFYLGIKLVHIASGDQAESITIYDQHIRSVTSLLSNIQICFSEKSKKNIDKIFSSIPYLKSNSFYIGNPVFKNFNLEKLKNPYNEKFDLVLLHPQSRSATETKKDILKLKKLISDKKTIFIEGNNDENSNLIKDFYKKLKNNKKYIFVKNLKKLEYFSHVKYCQRFITNSSSIDEIIYLNKKSLIVIGKRNLNRNHDNFIENAPEKLIKILKNNRKIIIKN